MIRILSAAALAAMLATPALASEPFQPTVIQWGATTAQMQTALTGKCQTITTRAVDPPFLDHTTKQAQIDCEGFVFRGKGRHAEFVIGDDALKMVWIMTDADEDDTLRRAMTAEYGAPDHHNARYDAFVAHRAALRTDKHEVLFYSEAAAGDCEPDFAPDK